MACSPWGYQELDTTERLQFHFSLSCIEEGNGNPLQCAVYGVTQSQTRLKCSSSIGDLFREGVIIPDSAALNRQLLLDLKPGKQK